MIVCWRKGCSVVRIGNWKRDSDLNGRRCKSRTYILKYFSQAQYQNHPIPTTPSPGLKACCHKPVVLILTKRTFPVIRPLPWTGNCRTLASTDALDGLLLLREVKVDDKRCLRLPTIRRLRRGTWSSPCRSSTTLRDL
jgi:hypothetical protein